MVYELSEGKPPYSEVNALKALYMIARMGKPSLSERREAVVSEGAKRFMDKCTVMNSWERGSAKELLEGDEWVKWAGGREGDVEYWKERIASLKKADSKVATSIKF
eukprot:TRINITY_DN1123_c0_g1_i3.p1 TRINITY_DN1123_c0_g1~~TRINITY_DN1123_c0_g1_i3.p1  ORF type:complete len:106 (-),score=45.06 TRINITY_DN1123_c0_g1_i3:238-555(-)